MNIISIVRRTAKACVSGSTVKRCRRELIEDEKETVDGRTGQGKPKNTVDDFTTGCICRIVHSFYRNGDHPTLDKLLARCQEEIAGLPMISCTSFWRLIKTMGFSYKNERYLTDHDGEGRYCTKEISLLERNLSTL